MELTLYIDDQINDKIVFEKGTGNHGDILSEFKEGDEIHPEKYEGLILRFKHDESIKQTIDFLEGLLEIEKENDDET